MSRLKLIPQATKRPYLMPGLDWKFEEFDLEEEETTLVQVAGLNLLTPTPPRSNSQEAIDRMADPLKLNHESMKSFKTGIVFVIDTTSSMGPYIEQAKALVQRVYTELEQRELLHTIGFGLIGYRDNLAPNARINYVTCIFQPLDPDADTRALVNNIKHIKPARVSTKNWREDAFAGVAAAIEELDWSPFAARLIILMSDASARTGTDTLSKIKYLDVAGLRDMAARKRIAIIPVHLLTKQAQRAGDIEPAREQDEALAQTQTGDLAVNKYFGVAAGSVEAFRRQINALADVIERIARQTDQGLRQQVPELNRDLLSGASEVTETSEPRLGDVVVNEIFRAQLEYLGDIQATEAPRFYRAWAADRDLIYPDIPSLDVRVFLTRNQLSNLASSLQRLVDKAKSAATSAETLFDDLQTLAAMTSVDASREPVNEDRDFVLGKLLPAFLKVLPYRSRVLQLDKQLWLDLGLTQQKEFIDDLEAKLGTYRRRINEDQDNWIDFGDNDPGLEMFAIQLEHLP